MHARQALYRWAIYLPLVYPEFFQMVWGWTISLWFSTFCVIRLCPQHKSALSQPLAHSDRMDVSLLSRSCDWRRGPPSYLGLWLYLLHSLTLTRWESWEGRWRSLSLFTNWHWPCMLTGSPGQHSSPKIKGSSCLSSSLPRQRSRKPCQENSETLFKDAKVWSQLPPFLDSL